MDSNFFKVPNKIFDVHLSSKAIAVFCCLMRHAGNKLQCFPARALIANECGISVSTVDRALAELTDRGFVHKVARKNTEGGKTSNMYYLDKF